MCRFFFRVTTVLIEFLSTYLLSIIQLYMIFIYHISSCLSVIYFNRRPMQHFERIMIIKVKMYCQYNYIYLRKVYMYLIFIQGLLWNIVCQATLENYALYFDSSCKRCIAPLDSFKQRN